MPQVLRRHMRALSPMGRPLGNHLCLGGVGRPWFPSSTLSALNFIVSVIMWRTPDTVRVVFLVLALLSWSAWVAASLYRVCRFLRWVKLDTHTHTEEECTCAQAAPFLFLSTKGKKHPIDTIHPLPALLQMKLLVYTMRLKHLSEISSGCCGISWVSEFQGDKNLAILVWGSQTWLHLTHLKELLTIFILSSLSPISPDLECPEGGLEISLFNKQLGDSHETSLVQIHGCPYIFSSVLK